MKASLRHLIVHRPPERAPAASTGIVEAALAASRTRPGDFDFFPKEPHPALAIDLEETNLDLVALGDFRVRANG